MVQINDEIYLPLYSSIFPNGSLKVKNLDIRTKRGQNEQNCPKNSSYFIFA